jgi:hypothetical protein
MAAMILFLSYNPILQSQIVSCVIPSSECSYQFTMKKHPSVDANVESMEHSLGQLTDAIHSILLGVM